MNTVDNSLTQLVVVHCRQFFFNPVTNRSFERDSNVRPLPADFPRNGPANSKFSRSWVLSCIGLLLGEKCAVAVAVKIRVLHDLHHSSMAVVILRIVK